MNNLKTSKTVVATQEAIKVGGQMMKTLTDIHQLRQVAGGATVRSSSASTPRSSTASTPRSTTISKR
jgi:hypothetical protein